MAGYQLRLSLGVTNHTESNENRKDLGTLLGEDLDFHGQDSGYASHNFHSFPAKFPPQLPRKFIAGLTDVGDVVLDPMVGSGTTIVEAFLAGRRGVGFDIDPLALTISKVKVTPIDVGPAIDAGQKILEKAESSLKEREKTEQTLRQRWNSKTQQFVDYWFARETQIELQALASAIEEIADPDLKIFFQLAFSSTIITKSGGVSLALDLAHTRPHRAKVIMTHDGKVIVGKERVNDPSPRIKFLTKTLRPALAEFAKRLERNLDGIQMPASGRFEPMIGSGDAQSLPLPTDSVDLIVTSPPYASNAIDYMRAHKFSLVWMGYPIGDLGRKRKEYIGGEAVTDIEFAELPDVAAAIVAEIAKVDGKKSRVLHRYYSEMTRTLQEMFRVLKPGKVAIVVVGNSTMRGQDTRTDICLADIGKTVGFEVPRIGVRNLDRNRRMMPAGMKLDLDSQIQQRMHHEFIIGFQKPTA